MSGRGLLAIQAEQFKLESIKGYQVERSVKRILFQRFRIGVSVIGRNQTSWSADKLLYALCVMWPTVDTIPLIASSVMSKKIAAGADAKIC